MLRHSNRLWLLELHKAHSRCYWHWRITAGRKWGQKDVVLTLVFPPVWQNNVAKDLTTVLLCVKTFALSHESVYNTWLTYTQNWNAQVPSRSNHFNLGLLIFNKETRLAALHLGLHPKISPRPNPATAIFTVPAEDMKVTKAQVNFGAHLWTRCSGS